MVRAFRDAFLLMTALSIVGLVLAFFVRDRVLEQFRSDSARSAREQEEPNPAAAK
jgi:hypothetical protein